jgi:hypothetical protein
MCVDGLEQSNRSQRLFSKSNKKYVGFCRQNPYLRWRVPQSNPDVHRNQMEIPRYCTVQNRTSDGPEPQNKHLRWMSILGCQSKRRRILMMNLMNIFIQRAPMQCPMHPVVKSIFHHKEPTDLPDHRLPVREGDVKTETKVCDDGMEEVDLGEFDGEVLE